MGRYSWLISTGMLAGFTVLLPASISLTLTRGASGDILGAMNLTADWFAPRARRRIEKSLPAGEVPGARRCAIF